MAKAKEEAKETKVPKEKKDKTPKKEKAEKAKIESIEEMTEAEKVIDKSTGFNWHNGTDLEKGAFIGSMICLLGAIVCLVCEFVMPGESWPFIWFDIFIGLSFIGETLTHWRLKRKIAIVTGIGGVAFTIFGILKLVGVIVA